MAKTFITSGTGSSQTLDSIQNEKVPVYNTRADAEADLANLEENQIVATKDSGATEKVVDVVQDGNMNAVTSNAVNDAISIGLPEEKCGTYFGAQMYHKGYLFQNLNITANTNQILDNNFELLYSKVVGAKGFLVGNNLAWTNDVKVYILSDKTLAINSTLGGSGLSVMLEFYYIK